MQYNLQTLISILETEREDLRERIADCVKEEEFNLAHYHSLALHQVNSTLHSLHNLEEKNYDNIISLSNHIGRIKNILAKHDLSEQFRDMYAWMEQDREKIKMFLNAPDSHEVNPIFDKTLKQLAECKIRSFKLILNKKTNLLIHFSISGEVIQCVIPHLKKQLDLGTLDKKQIHRLMNLGFSQHGEDIVMLVLKKEQTILLTTNISRIVFEVFHFSEFVNESFIVIEN